MFTGNSIRSIRKFLADESGPTSVEYAVMLALILAVCIGAVRALGDGQTGMWGKNLSELERHGF
ncbi:Flp/Fap pilin component [Thalassoglobus neptunius]|uniref:Flp/Fap pilin component n=1 Tax=Thalassoglobus neptunius TaxID=1938619 RepID=A0A5C5X3B1_9PLAN|nr:Flp family type IVb pilin [Thalassoglobus neptunius]TWT57446.1 Flp/Fap pilin component [Thalassoglobus neptunius]